MNTCTTADAGTNCGVYNTCDTQFDQPNSATGTCSKCTSNSDNGNCWPGACSVVTGSVDMCKTTCQDNSDCNSNLCTGSMCVECDSDSDCDGLASFYGKCLTASNVAPTSTAKGGACSTSCTTSTATTMCTSNYCSSSVCAACTADANCATLTAAKESGTPNFHCANGDDGNPNTGVCMQCSTIADCGTNYYGLCTNGICSSSCATATQAANCSTGFCQTPGGNCVNGLPNPVTTNVCGMCTDDASCSLADGDGYTCNTTTGICTAPNTESSDDDNLGLILGLTIPIGVILIAVAGFCYWKKKQQDDDR